MGLSPSAPPLLLLVLCVTTASFATALADGTGADVRSDAGTILWRGSERGRRTATTGASTSDGGASERLVAGEHMRIIGHRGGMLMWVPEHTVLSYTLGAELGADFLEPDVVSTKDGVLVCRHDILLDDSTDVAQHPEFAHLYTTKEVFFPWPENKTGWFVEDFTWAQLQTLRAVSRLGHGSGPLDATYRILKFDTMLQLTANLSATFGRPIGVYPETKHADHYAAVGLALEGKTLAALEAAGFLGPSAASLTPPRVIMQSFIRTSLQQLKQLAPTVPRVQLIEDAATLLAAEARGADIPTVTEAGLQAIAGYATGIGIDKDVVLDPRTWAWASSSHVVATAHDHQLTVDVYTLNANITEYEQVAEAGVDGLFTNNVNAAFIVRELLPQLLRRSKECATGTESCQQELDHCRWLTDELSAALGIATFTAVLAGVAVGVMCCADRCRQHTGPLDDTGSAGSCRHRVCRWCANACFGHESDGWLKQDLRADAGEGHVRMSSSPARERRGDVGAVSAPRDRVDGGLELRSVALDTDPDAKPFA